MPPEAQAIDHSVNAVAERIAARRAEGNAPEPEPVEEVNDEPSVHTDDDLVTPEALEQEALGEEEVAAEEIEATDEDEPTDAEPEDEQDIELAFESVDELAELLGLETNDLLSKVKVGTVIDGEAGEITLADLRKGHQLEASFTRKNQAFLEAKKQFEDQQESKRTEIEDHFAKATATMQMAQQQLYSDFSGVDWNALQRDNPAEWTLKRQQFGERQARLQNAMQQTTAQLTEAREKQKQEQTEAQERHLEEQHNLLMASVPAWKDPDKAATEGAKVASYLQTMGYTPEELNDLSDHRLILLGRAAMGLAGPTKAKLDLAKKKVKEVQNLVKPGNAQQRRQSGKAAFTKKAQEAAKLLKKSGSTEAAAQALLARRQARDASAKRGRRSRV